MSAVTVQRWADAEKEFERVTEIVSIVPIESVGAIIDGELRAEADVDTVAVRQVADVTKRVCAYGKYARVSAGI